MYLKFEFRKRNVWLIWYNKIRLFFIVKKDCIKLIIIINNNIYNINKIVYQRKLLNFWV